MATSTVFRCNGCRGSMEYVLTDDKTIRNFSHHGPTDCWFDDACRHWGKISFQYFDKEVDAEDIEALKTIAVNFHEFTGGGRTVLTADLSQFNVWLGIPNITIVEFVKLYRLWDGDYSKMLVEASATAHTIAKEAPGAQLQRDFLVAAFEAIGSERPKTKLKFSKDEVQEPLLPPASRARTEES